MNVFRKGDDVSTVSSWPALKVYPERRVMNLIGAIDEPMYINVANALPQFQGTEPVTVLFSTTGGDVDSGLGIFNLLNQAPFPLHIIVTGYAYSMGGIILQAGTKRYITPNASVMLHWGYAVNEDTNADNYKRKQKFQDKQDDLCNEILFQRMVHANPKLTKGNLKRKTVLDWYMSADEAVEHGVCDAVWTGPIFPA